MIEYKKHNIMVYRPNKSIAIILTTAVLVVYYMTTSTERGVTNQRSYYDGRDFPQVIGIGARKCGTGALRTFIGKHSKIALTTKREPHFFDLSSNYEKGQLFYSSLMPTYVQEGTLIFEKTPKYFPTSQAPGRIRDFYNETRPKLILLLCDPVGRLYSDYTMMMKPKKHKLEIVKQMGSFNEYVQRGIEYINHKTNTFDNNMDIDTWVKAMRNVFPEDLILPGTTLYSGFFTGMYAIHMHNWLSYFDKQDILLLDGKTLITKPWVTMKKVQKFLNLEAELTKDNFVFDSDKMLYCIQTAGDKKCVNKGSTRAINKNKTSSKIPPDTADKLRAFYKPFNDRLLELISEYFSWME